MLTFALAYSSSPPIGANMMPTMKNSGRTVFGVKMGLLRVVSRHLARCRGALCIIRTAMPSSAAAGMPYLKPVSIALLCAT